MRSRTRTLTPDEADDLWSLCHSLDGTVRTFTAKPKDRSAAELQRAVDRAASGATAAVLVPAVPALGGFVTRMVVRKASESVTGAARTGVMVSAVLAACRIAEVADEAEQVGVVARAVFDRELPADWRPPSQPRRGGARAAHALSDERPDHSSLWQRSLGMLPVLGMVGEGLGGQRTVTVVLSRACRELGLPEPSSASPARSIRNGLQGAAAAVRSLRPGD